jgi:hypothetical protein
MTLTCPQLARLDMMSTAGADARWFYGEDFSYA